MSTKINILSKTVFSRDDDEIHKFAVSFIQTFCAATLKSAKQQSENAGLENDALHAKIAGRMSVSVEELQRVINPTINNLPFLSLITRFVAACGGNIRITLGAVSNEFQQPAETKDRLQKLIVDGRNAVGLTTEEIAAGIGLTPKEYEIYESSVLTEEPDFLTFLCIGLALGDIPKIAFRSVYKAPIHSVASKSPMPQSAPPITPAKRKKKPAGPHSLCNRIDSSPRIKEILEYSLSIIEEFSNAAMEAAHQQGMQQHDVGNLMGLSQPRVNKILNPTLDYMPGISILMRLAVACGGHMELTIGSRSFELRNEDEAEERVHEEFGLDPKRSRFSSLVRASEERHEILSIAFISGPG
jgi:transcriptional regulator with XRE-family HTH domain